MKTVKRVLLAFVIIGILILIYNLISEIENKCTVTIPNEISSEPLPFYNCEDCY